ncbi:hypothetical protein KIH74_29150 [Kineosporia sp. J2-2]|uniref:Uncharacterized protein n=1 Tax=Kineosporia corallincola TaxID=2835133 RepID=A0ABS5TPM6_9ACTN|nr:hypothetical protein [Kineosporia corallincola]MBT0773046.1 hypothetical protein [Kineosporia corallincola]
MHTYGSALALIGVTVPDHLPAEAGVPVLQAPQAQGDLLILPAAAPEGTSWCHLPDSGEQVVHGEATGNTHWLHRGFDSPGVRWARATDDEPLVVGYVEVPEGQSALLVHTDEHGANGIGPGTYAIHRKREFVRPEPKAGSNPLVRGLTRRPDANAWDLIWD